MEDRLDGALARIQEIEQLFRRDQVGKIAFGDVAPLLVTAQPVTDHDIALAGRLQGSDEIGTDEAGAAGDDDHGQTFPKPFVAGQRSHSGC